MSKRELEAKFTKSELFIVAWRSREVAWHLQESQNDKKKYKQNDDEEPLPKWSDVSSEREMRYKKQRRRPKIDPRLPANLPDHFFNEEGELDLRGVKGHEAWKFLASQGLKLPIMQRNEPKK